MAKTHTPALVLLAGIGVILVGPQPARAYSSGIIGESISDYTYVSGGSHGNDTDANAEIDGFYSAMTAAGTPWTTLVRYRDNSVYDTDFTDPDRTGAGYDNDTSNFDKAGAAIAMTVLHGQCDDLTTATCPCGFGSYCAGSPPPPAGISRACISELPRSIVTSSTNSSRGNVIRYGRDTLGSWIVDLMRLGESPSSGGWGGGGTNGGANVSIIVNSCGVRGPYIFDTLFNMHAGVHSILMTMPTGAWVDGTGKLGFSDTAQWGGRGSSLATLILANDLGAVADTWLSWTMLSHSFVALGSGSYKAAIGAQLLTSVDSSSTNVNFHALYESWAGVRLDSNDAVGNGWYYFRWSCNYDCNTYGL